MPRHNVCKSGRLRLSLFLEETILVNQLTVDYKGLAAKLSGSDVTDGVDAKAAAPLLAVLAQIASLHPLIYEEAIKRKAQCDTWDEEFGGEKEEQGGESRDDWLLLVRARENLCSESARIVKLIKLFGRLRSDILPKKSSYSRSILNS
jgi:hypothetical protein